MEHFVNFGYVKQTNKNKKRFTEAMESFGVNLVSNKKAINEGLSRIPPDELSLLAKNNPDRIRQNRYNKKGLSNPSSKEDFFINEPTPYTEGFTDIRKTTDKAASPTGYLGFRTDPYKGYGGMMEEPVPSNAGWKWKNR